MSTFDQFLAQCVSDSVNAAPSRPCPECEGSGRVAVHVCTTEAECKRLCLRVQSCIACGGNGLADALQRSCPQCADNFTPEGTERG